MEQVCGGPKPYLSSDQLELEHIRCREKALEQFRIKRKMGGDEFSESYRSQLEQVKFRIVFTNPMRRRERWRYFCKIYAYWWLWNRCNLLRNAIDIREYYSAASAKRSGRLRWDFKFGADCDL